jgi:phosphatidylserine decarboxylase
VVPGSGPVTECRYQDDKAIRFAKGEEMGRFRLGSTVIMVMPKGRVHWNRDQVPGKSVRMGEAFGTLA